MIFRSSTLALFGEIELDQLERDVVLFDQKIHYFGASIPRWLFPKVFQARSRMNSSWWKDTMPSHQPQLMDARQALFLQNSDWLSKPDVGTFQSALFWASSGNTIPAVFLVFILHLITYKVIKAITQELDTYSPFFSLDSDTDESLVEEWTPENLNSCVYLDSAVNETLRLVTTPLVIRKCRQETEIVLQDGRTLKVQPDETLAHFVSITHLSIC